MKCEFRIVRADSDSIMPFKQSSADMRWNRYINNPVRDMVKATRIFIWIRDPWYL